MNPSEFEHPTAVAQAAAEHIRRELLPPAGLDRIDLALVLGSGWNQGVDQLGDEITTVPLDGIPGFSKPVVAGHGGALRLARTANGKVAMVLTGRTHYYEGRGVAPVVHGVRTAAALGASMLVLTNGCGGLDPTWAPGTPVLIKDHINLTGATPLRGATFIDLSEAYSRRLMALAREVDPSLPEGVYVQFSGPQYETPAEVRMAGILGGNLVGMSTALETIAAREAGLEVLGISLVTNAAAGITEAHLDHTEVLTAGKDAGPKLTTLLTGLLERL
ncbi:MULTISPECIES: purine-nucleoside phosphorylase [unclassified Luteococcus]|uniref:purine-nucleoside phosphorylase n=1 Tax=unclassified Luteococcus TaxID=2639923 RepID=UPI00313B4BBD